MFGEIGLDQRKLIKLKYLEDREGNIKGCGIYMKLEIREVRKEDKNQVKEMYDEYMNSELIPGIDRFEGIRDFENLEKMNFNEWIEVLEKNKDQEQLPKEYSSHTLYLVIDKNKRIVGAMDLRWREVPVLMKFGGLIGYSVRPSERGKGYATKMLKLALEEFKKINKEKLLITCKDFNIASRRVIEKNNGIYESSYYNEDDKYTYLKYWIKL